MVEEGSHLLYLKQSCAYLIVVRRDNLLQESLLRVAQDEERGIERRDQRRINFTLWARHGTSE